MPIQRDTREMTRDVWMQLLDELEAQIPMFVQTFTAELRERALYEVGLVPEEDLIRAAGEAMHMLISRLRGDDTALTAFANELGQRRARQGVPLERLLEAIRLDLRIIWQMLLQLASPDRVPVLVQHVERLMTVLDEYIDDVQHAFLAEVAILQRDSRLATEQHLSKLFNATTLSPALLGEVAKGIGIDSASEFEVILFKPQDSRDEPQREVQHWLTMREVFAYVYRGWLLLFRELGPKLSSWPREFAGTPSLYVHRVEGLGAVAAAARAAVELQTVAPDIARLTDIEELWSLGAEEYLDSLVPGYFRSVLADVEGLAPEERERLIGTVGAFLTTGSIKVAAARMGCHRNTVVNRLRQFQELTGLDLTVPTQAALAVVLLAADPVLRRQRA